MVVISAPVIHLFLLGIENPADERNLMVNRIIFMAGLLELFEVQRP